MGSWKGFHFVTFVTKPSVQSSSQRVVQGLRRRLNQSCSTGLLWKVQLRLHQASLQAPAFHSATIPTRFGGHKDRGLSQKTLQRNLQRYQWPICTDTRSAAISPTDSGAQQPCKLHSSELLRRFLKRPGGFCFPRDTEEGAICSALNDLM